MRTFGAETLVFAREEKSGLSPFAYYVGKTIAGVRWFFYTKYVVRIRFFGLVIGCIQLLALPVMFGCVFHAFAAPRAPFHEFCLIITFGHFVAQGRRRVERGASSQDADQRFCCVCT